MKHLIVVIFLAVLVASCEEKVREESALPSEIWLTRATLEDKIMGGWAGQVIGCTFGGPTEFRYQSKMIPEDTLITWDSTRIKWYFDYAPGLFDDVYMDLTFLDVFERKGFKASARDHGDAFANAEYMLWHANQAARYNILNGIDPPESGYWENNPHSDDIDFQIEADFAGLMSPGMPNTSSDFCDVVGHIMNYGDGYYGGVYVAAMYSLAFVTDEIEVVISEALKTIPIESTFYKCMNDVIKLHDKYPDNWRTTWREIEDKWSSDIGCPDGVFTSFNIDAKINAAYMLIGLLYGNGDYGETIEIATRCGQDSDCNPASAAGILGTMIGYSAIPGYWKQGLNMVEDVKFEYTTMSLKDVYRIGLKQATEVIMLNGGEVNGEEIRILVQHPVSVPLEQGFEKSLPVERIIPDSAIVLNGANRSFQFDFYGTGFVVSGSSQKIDEVKKDRINQVLVNLDGEEMERSKMPTDFTTRKHEITWKYNLPEGKHNVSLELINPEQGYQVSVDWILIYDEAMAD